MKEIIQVGLLNTIQFIVSHPLNKGKPLSSVYRFAAWQLKSRFRDELIFDWVGGSKLAVLRGMAGATGNIYCGLHEYTDMSFVLHTLQPGDLFVDVGANVGSYSILASKVCRANVVAIEPDPVTAIRLQRNFEVNDVVDISEIAETAVGASQGTVSFTIGLDTVNKVADKTNAEVRSVNLTTVDVLLANRCPRVIKMDVEGYEDEVLKGMEKTLGCSKLLAVISESSGPDVVNKLKEFGFREHFYDPTSKKLSERRSYQSNNSLFLKESNYQETLRALSASKRCVFRGVPI